MQRNTKCKQYTPRTTYHSVANILNRVYTFLCVQSNMFYACVYHENEKDKNKIKVYNLHCVRMFNRAKSGFCDKFHFPIVGWESHEPICNTMRPLFIQALSHLTLKWWPKIGLILCDEMIHTPITLTPHPYSNGDYGIEVSIISQKCQTCKRNKIYHC